MRIGVWISSMFLQASRQKNKEKEGRKWLAGAFYKNFPLLQNSCKNFPLLQNSYKNFPLIQKSPKKVQKNFPLLQKILKKPSENLGKKLKPPKIIRPPFDRGLSFTTYCFATACAY
jgi:hypothetical protein